MCGAGRGPAESNQWVEGRQKERERETVPLGEKEREITAADGYVSGGNPRESGRPFGQIDRRASLGDE